MRRGQEQFLLEDDSGFFGFNLGADSVAEHEVGIPGLQQLFGLKAATHPEERVVGMEDRRITRLPESLQLHKPRKSKNRNRPWVLALVDVYNLERFQEGKSHVHSELHEPYRPPDSWPGFVGGWDDRSFGLAAYTDPVREKLERLWEAFQKKDGCIWVGGAPMPVFCNAGLNLSIYSAIPEQYKTLMRERDLEHHRLLDTSAATGIEKKLKEAGRRWHALVPKWANTFKNPDYASKTKYPVIYWLNPMEQHLYNCGYFTVEELGAWAEGKGPIIKSKTT